MTQAISLYQILSRHGHQLSAVMVGQSQSRIIPQFFVKQIQAPVFTFYSPNFQLDTKRRGVSFFRTLVYNLKRLPAFVKSLFRLRRTVRIYQPEIMVNFYDPLAAIYAALWRPKIKMVCIAHQYLMLHPRFVFPRGKRIARWAMLFFTRVSAWGADKCLALSFRWMPDVPAHNLVVVPPLLRAEIKKLKPTTENFILSYVLNDGYANDIAAEHRHYSDLKILGFWDHRESPGVTRLQENLKYRQLDDIAFMDAMRRCCGLVSTAGFESICEAMYLGKPVFMIPVKKQIEQYCNAIDAYRAGAGLWGFDFDLTRFLDYIPKHRGNFKPFKKWVHSAEGVYASLFKGQIHDE